MEDALITLVVFAGIYQIIKVFTDYLLKRKLINAGQYDKAGILDVAGNKEENSFPTLKWGLIAFFAGLGLLVIAMINKGQSMGYYESLSDSYLSVGIELIAISLGFLVYFFIARGGKK